MKRLPILIATILFPPPILADETDFQTCHNMSADSMRLACYDELTDFEKTKKDIEENDNTGKKDVATFPKSNGQHWRYSEDVSALDNRKDVWLSVISKNTESNSIGSPIRATLWVRCMENKTNVLIGFDRYTTDNQSVRYKFDDLPIQEQWMETMRGGDGIGIWHGARAIPFIREMTGKERLVIAYNTYSGPVEFTFDISGLGSRITPLAKECEWAP